MAYRDFSFMEVKKRFQLQEHSCALFAAVAPLEASAWLQETLSHSVQLALSSSSEKARSEFIIAPVLLEMERRNPHTLAIFSGERLDVDKDQGLVGECDFILARGPLSAAVQAPILALVEAKRNDIKEGLGQCVAQMMGASLFNQMETTSISRVYGCVTTGEDWQFLQLCNTDLLIDRRRYYLNELNQLLGIFQCIVDAHQR